MVRKLKPLIAIICLGLFSGAWPSSGLYPLIRQNGSIVTAAYSGPGDIITTNIRIWVGLRAYNNTLANAGATTTPVIDVLGVNTSTGCTIYLKGDGTGDLDFTTAGSGGVGNQCLLGATTFCTVTNAGGCTISKAYDQSGALACQVTVACNAVQVTAAAQPILQFNCIGTKPCMVNNDTLSFQSGTKLTSTQSQPLSVSSVSSYDATTNFANIIGDTNNGDPQIGYNNTPKAFVYAGTASMLATYVASNGAARNDVLNGTSSTINLNGTETADGTNIGTTTFVNTAQFPDIFTDGFGDSGHTLKISEVGMWGTGFSAGNRTSLCQNQQSYYGSANFGATC